VRRRAVRICDTCGKNAREERDARAMLRLIFRTLGRSARFGSVVALPERIMKFRTTKLVLASFAFAAALGSMGCTVEARPAEPVAYADDDSVDYVATGPVIDVNTYPYEVYGGRNVYYVGDRWYYRDGGRWAYYRHEPRFLYGRRQGRRGPVRHEEHREEHHDRR
jgi:hypothetical protein